jgi:hypothetical protein
MLSRRVTPWPDVFSVELPTSLVPIAPETGGLRPRQFGPALSQAHGRHFTTSLLRHADAFAACQLNVHRFVRTTLASGKYNGPVNQ